MKLVKRGVLLLAALIFLISDATEVAQPQAVSDVMHRSADLIEKDPWVMDLEWLDSSEDIHHSEVDYWQSYSASPQGGVHRWIDTEADYRVFEVDAPASVRSGFLYATPAAPVLNDLANPEYFQLSDGAFVRSEKKEYVNFVSDGYVFSHDDDELAACESNDPKNCVVARIPTGTWPYAWASSNGSVVVITNRGLAMLFRHGDWQQMHRHGDVYDLDPHDADVLEEKPTQFYSSIVFQGRTLIGEWPTGRLYEFDGERIVPSPLTMPKFDESAGERLGYEAQSMAEYCGDLFVGYWPRGEVYRMDGMSGEWDLFQRFFSETIPDPLFIPDLKDSRPNPLKRLIERPPDWGPFIPYSDHAEEDVDFAFFGQRITGLVPWEDSLWVSTSNLRSWDRTVDPGWPPIEIQEEYGNLYRIYKPGCFTSYESP